jgi:hypothetical protein
MPTLTLCFSIDGNQLEELEVAAPTGASLKALIADVKDSVASFLVEEEAARRGVLYPELRAELARLAKGRLAENTGDSDIG